LVTLLNSWYSVWSPKVIKVDFEAASFGTINVAIPDSVITGCNFQLNQSLWKQIQNVGLIGGIQRKLTTPTHMQNVRCFGTPTYQ
jgi:hypothetical protein